MKGRGHIRWKATNMVSIESVHPPQEKWRRANPQVYQTEQTITSYGSHTTFTLATSPYVNSYRAETVCLQAKNSYTESSKHFLHTYHARHYRHPSNYLQPSQPHFKVDCFSLLCQTRKLKFKEVSNLTEISQWGKFCTVYPLTFLFLCVLLYIHVPSNIWNDMSRSTRVKLVSLKGNWESQVHQTEKEPDNHLYAYLSAVTLTMIVKVHGFPCVPKGKSQHCNEGKKYLELSTREVAKPGVTDH